MGEAHADSADALRQELDLASRALREGDPAQAVRHLARAHERAPTEPSVQAAFAAVADTAGVDDAIVALAQIAEERPASGLEVVLASWLDAAARRGHTGPAAADRIARLLSTVSASTVGLHRLRPGERALLGGHGDLARAFAQRVTDDAHVATVAGVLRRTGGCDEALRLVGDRGHESCLVQRGLALRTQGHGASAAQAFAAAARTTDHKVFSVEEARSWFVAGDLARARALLEPLLPAADPETNWLAEACTQGGGGDPVAAHGDGSPERRR